MQIWRLLYGVSIEDLKKRFSMEEIRQTFTEQRKSALGEFFTSSVIASPTGTAATLAIWVEWEEKHEIWGHCMKGLLLGVHDGLEEYDPERTLSNQMTDLFNTNVKPIGRIRWIKEEFQEAISEVNELLVNALKQ